MNVFGIKDDNRTYKLTVDSYEEMTQKDKPYYLLTSVNNMAHYAICPSCKNPILIVNLYTENENRIYGKHHTHHVKGLADYSRQNYLKCPYSSPNRRSFNSNAEEEDQTKINDIIIEVNNYQDQIRKCIQRVTNINWSKNLFNRYLETFRAERGYYFRYVHYLNVPYSILYLSGRKSLVKQFLRKDESNDLIRVINNSQYFKVSQERQILRSLENNAQLDVFFTRYRTLKNESYITMKVEETFEEEINLLYQIEVLVDLGKYALIRENE